MRYLLILLLLCTGAAAQNTFPPIGGWREHLPYNNAVDVTSSPNKIFAATPYSLFSVDLANEELSHISKISGLSETGISSIRYDATNDKLYIGYTNSNIDVIDNKRINNIPDLKRENISGDKTIYDFYPSGNYCYVSTGVGVWVLDADKYETADSWFIGNGGGYVKTYMFTKDNSFFYAATDQGLKRTSVNTVNPSDFQAWQNLSGSNGLPPGPCRGVVNLQGKILALANDSVFAYNGSAWSLFFANGAPISSINDAGGKLSVNQNTGIFPQSNILNVDGSLYKTVQKLGVIYFPQRTILVGTTVWVADLYGGLVKVTGTDYEPIIPNGPYNIATGEMQVYNNVLYATAGSVNSSWNYAYNRAGVFQYKEGQWINYNQYRLPVLDSLMDFITVAVDPRDETVWAGSYGGGLLHIKDANTVEIFKQNSPIGPTIGDPSSYRVSGLAFDQNNNLWVANFGASQNLHVLKANGTWQSFVPPFFVNENALAQIVIDDADQVWIISPKGNGLVVFNHGSSLENTNDDKWRIFKSGAGNGNLPSGEVLCIAKDKSDFIWVGTADGIAVIQCAEQPFTNCEAVLPIVKNGNFANYLFKGDEVRSIAVDAADRKWVATRNGAWLISPDGDKLLEHFTEDNSPLLSNDVLKLTINSATGEVFFATAKGICSFRAGATQGADDYSNLLVYPNPVPPGYNGTIAIKGLKENSFIKITELNGRLVYQTRSLGGQAVWNGKDYNGGSIASGVYLVLVTDDAHTDNAVGKIVFISK